MGMLSDRMCGGDGFGEARKEGYPWGPYLARVPQGQRANRIRQWKENGGELSEAMEEELRESEKKKED